MPKRFSSQTVNSWRDHCLISFSGGQDSINLLIFYLIFFQLPFQKISCVWCHSLWKTKDFSLLRHSVQISFVFHCRLYYTLFFSQYFNENKARQFRYLFFWRIAFYSRSNTVLTAHTKNDAIETFFLNLFRGSGKLGLQSLRKSQPLAPRHCLQQFF